MRVLLIEDDENLSAVIEEQLQKRAILQTVALMAKRLCLMP